MSQDKSKINKIQNKLLFQSSLHTAAVAAAATVVGKVAYMSIGMTSFSFTNKY